MTGRAIADAITGMTGTYCLGHSVAVKTTAAGAAGQMRNRGPGPNIYGMAKSAIIIYIGIMAGWDSLGATGMTGQTIRAAGQ